MQLLICALIFLSCACYHPAKPFTPSNQQKFLLNLQLKTMFKEIILEKDVSMISKHYHPDFLLYSNGEKIDYKTFFESHQKFYANPIEYEIEFDEETLFEREDKIVGRIWVTTYIPNESTKKIEVILIAQFKENKIYRLWELSYPDLSNLSAFKEHT
jgi:hypothetical protein